MSDFEEETYSTIFTSLKHPVRRKILRMLSEKPRNFSEILEALRISSSHLTYHLENLRELISKTEYGKYKLSAFGEAAVTTMSKVEEAPKVTEPKRLSILPIKWKSFFVVLIIGLVALGGVSYTQYWSLNRLSAEHEQLSVEYEQLSVEYEKLKDLVVEFIRPVVANKTIYIRSDGSVDPPAAPIQKDGNMYIFTDNIIDQSIVVEKDNIVVDGAGYTFQGTGAFASSGIDLTGRSKVTIRNMKIRAFYYGIRLHGSSKNTISGNSITINEKGGIYLRYSSNNTISGNNVAKNEYGIRFYGSSSNSISEGNITNNERDGIDLWLSSDNTISGNGIRNNGYGIYLSSSSGNTVSGNNIEANNGYGVYLWRSSNNAIYYNNFVNNTQEVNICSSTNVWDDGAGKGNYWSDYEDRYHDAEEIDGSGIWDTLYAIDENNQDNYSLMNPWGLVEEEKEDAPFRMQWWFWVMVIAGIVVLAGAVYLLKKRKSPTPTATTLPTEDT